MNILQNAEFYVRELLATKLPGNRIFHNIQHTESVVNASNIICRNLNVTNSDKELVMLAAWFHDVGHVLTFHGHELESQHIASTFLEKYDFPKKKIEQITQIIGATQMPQSPSTILEEIICDADLFHLSSLDYCEIQDKLREELTLVLGDSYLPKEWGELNISFLKNHQYFTKYGKSVLAEKKEINIKLCEKNLQNKKNL